MGDFPILLPHTLQRIIFSYPSFVLKFPYGSNCFCQALGQDG
jgi:hypothetical protein